ncbi:MAG TPA: HD domain-containing protein, partial [Symbiobacteriaceae bacterium]|nr:HD domain-containing protein [Symbiobacteriaceae bacterium]
MIDRAIQFAVLAHGGQKRKGTETPYIVHPVGVAMLLAQAGCRPEVVAAGLLHDTIEDCGVT